jgi:hypothetical protein
MTEFSKSKGPKKRNPECYQTLRDIVIPAGTILRQAANERGGAGFLEVPIGHGKNFTSNLVVQKCLDAETCGDFKKVIA